MTRICVDCEGSLPNVNSKPGKPFAPSPGGSKIHHNDSGYFLWLELPEQLDAGELSAKALEHLISIAPGKMFSTSGARTRFFRFNTAWHWGEREEQAVKQLGSLIREMLSAKSLV